MLIIYPAETALFEIDVLYSPAELDSVEIDFEQDGEVKVTKTVTEISEYNSGRGYVEVELAPDETKLFEANHLAHYQVKCNIAGFAGYVDILPAIGFGVLPYAHDRKHKCRRSEQAETYDGDYHIKTNFAPITMLTKGKLMTDDVSIDAAQPTADVVSAIGAGETSITFTGLRNEPSAFSVLYHGSWTGFMRKVACIVWQGGEDDDSKAIYRTGNNTNIVRTGGFSWTYNNGTLTVTLTGSATASAFDGTYYLCYDAVR